MFGQESRSQQVVDKVFNTYDQLFNKFGVSTEQKLEHMVQLFSQPAARASVNSFKNY